KYVVVSKVFPTTHFGYRKITVERPLRLNFQASSDRIGRLDEQTAFQNLAVSKKKDPKVRAREEAEGRAEQEALRGLLRALPTTLLMDRREFLDVLRKAEESRGPKLTAALRKAVTAALAERDKDAAICLDEDGHPEPDSELRDTENVPLSEGIEVFFEREVR